MTYERLLSSTTSTTLEEPRPLRALKLDEISIQSFWFAGHFPDHYQSQSGKQVKIISPGEWNRGAGPDFIEATVEIEGELFHGPIELDLEAKNWNLHGHATSESFNKVILHVVLEDEGPDFFTRTSEHREVQRVVIPRDALTTALGLPRLSQALARPGRCLQPLNQLPAEAVDSLLQQASRHRCQLKAQRFHRISERHGFTQALWEAFADSLGFAANRLPMRLLAQRLPIKKLLKLTPDEAESVLFGTAGFLSPKLHETAPEDSRRWLEDLWDRWWMLRQNFEFPEDRSPTWKLAGSRPGNHPQRRLAALSTAVPLWRSLVAQAREEAPFNKLADSLSSVTHDFWDHHHTLQSRKKRRLGPHTPKSEGALRIKR